MITLSKWRRNHPIIWGLKCRSWCELVAIFNIQERCHGVRGPGPKNIFVDRCQGAVLEEYNRSGHGCLMFWWISLMLHILFIRNKTIMISNLCVYRMKYSKLTLNESWDCMRTGPSDIYIRLVKMEYSGWLNSRIKTWQLTFSLEVEWVSRPCFTMNLVGFL